MRADLVFRRGQAFLPDGRHFLYLALNLAGAQEDEANQIWAGSLDGHDHAILAAYPRQPTQSGTEAVQVVALVLQAPGEETRAVHGDRVPGRDLPVG